jgi:hypothetical protein
MRKKLQVIETERPKFTEEDFIDILKQLKKQYDKANHLLIFTDNYRLSMLEVLRNTENLLDKWPLNE